MTLCRVCTPILGYMEEDYVGTLLPIPGVNRVPVPEAADWGGPVEEQYIIYVTVEDITYFTKQG